jgi:hypothetical protein
MGFGLTYDSGTYRGVCVGFRSWSGSPESRYVWGGDGPNMIRRQFLEMAGRSALSPLFADAVPNRVRTERYSVSREGVYDLRLYQEGSGRVHIQFLELRAAVSVKSWDDAYRVAQYIDDVVTDFSAELQGESVYRFQIRGRDAVLHLDRWMIVYRGTAWSIGSKKFVADIFDFPVPVEVDTESELLRGLELF